MKNIISKLLIFGLILTTYLYGCKKEFLDEKPSTSIIQPSSLDEFEGLLDNTGILNTTLALGTLAADEYTYRSYEAWLSTKTSTERNSFIWAKDMFAGEIDGGDWNMPYSAIFYANNVLAGLNRIEVNVLNATRWKKIRGWALFVRSYAYYDLVRNFAPTYDNATANKDLGVPLRLNPSIDEILPRSTVQETYGRILLDLEQATQLLDGTLPVSNRNRPSKIAAHALASRIFLNMRNYIKAEAHADSCLQLYDKLIDYNTINPITSLPFSNINDESIYYVSASSKYLSIASSSLNTYTQISQEVLDLYEKNDLRPSIFFTKEDDNIYSKKRGYAGSSSRFPFVGLATDEIYLIKAECAARRNDIKVALNYLNLLLIKRYITDKFIPFTANTSIETLNKILLERRKELVWRNLRWDDLKRLNKEGANITLTRVFNGQIYNLEPNSLRYIFPIPDNEINLSGIQQNPR